VSGVAMVTGLVLLSGCGMSGLDAVGVVSLCMGGDSTLGVVTGCSELGGAVGMVTECSGVGSAVGVSGVVG